MSSMTGRGQEDTLTLELCRMIQFRVFLELKIGLQFCCYTVSLTKSGPQNYLDTFGD